MSNRKERRSNPLLSNSEEEATQEQRPEPMPEEVVAEVVAEKKAVVVSIPDPEPMIAPVERRTLDLPPRPPVKRKRQKELRFGDIYETRSFSIDKRLVKFFDDYMGQGETKTSFANQLFLKILIDAGYQLDPDLLTKPPK